MSAQPPQPATLDPRYAGLVALSIRQPWAWLIVNGYKPVENRTWWTAFRGPFLIHASKRLDLVEYEEARSYGIERGVPGDLIPGFDEMDRGGIVGVATLSDCWRDGTFTSDFGPSANRDWFEGPFGFALKDVEPLPFVPCRGALGFFKPVFGVGPQNTRKGAEIRRGQDGQDLQDGELRLEPR